VVSAAEAEPALPGASRHLLALGSAPAPT